MGITDAALARLFGGVREGIFIGEVSATGSRTVAANPHLKLLLGHAHDAPDAEVRPFDATALPDAQARALFLDRLHADGSVRDYLLRLRRADGALLWVEVTAQATADAHGTLQVDALLRDVTERKQRDDETREIYHQLLQAEKMAALGQTVSGVAHELNNPLATILTRAERLAQHPSLDAALAPSVTTIVGEAERAARIVRSLLTFARKRQTTRAMVDLNQLVRETLALRAYEQRVTNIAVLDALAAGLPQVFADGHQLQQVLLNLIINAEQAMGAAHGRGQLLVRSWHDAGRGAVVLEVHDDGPGIPEEMQARIFDPFFTTKEVGQGTGLGLTVAYAIVQEHGGQLRLASDPTGGTSFVLELPVTTVRVPAAQGPRMQQVESVVRGSASILVVDDEVALGAAVCEALRDAGYAVEQVTDGEQALARATTTRFDLLVCDLRMPKLDGRALYARLRETVPPAGHAPRMLFMTGDVIATDAEQFLDASGSLWLAKPFRLADMVRAVREALLR